MKSLEQQMVIYGEILEEEQGKLSLDEIAPLHAYIIELDEQRRDWPKWLGFALGVAVVLILLGLVPLFSRQDQPPVATAPVPSTTPGPAPTDPVTTEPAPTTIIPRAAESVTWTQHPGGAPLAGWIRETSVGLLAIHAEDFQAPLVYMSSNGFDWSEVPIPAVVSVALPEDHRFDVEPSSTGVWLTGPTGRLWFADLETWSSGEPSWEEVVSEADLLDSKGLPPSGTRWAAGISGKARIANTSLFTVEWELKIDYEAILDLPPGYTDVQHDDLDTCFSGGTPGQLSIRGTDSSGREVCLTTVTVVDGADGVSVLNEDGDQVAFIENAVAEFDYGSGGPHIFPPSQMLDLYASTDGQLELVRTIDGTYPCGHGLEQTEDSVVHSIDCPTSTLNGALSTDDGVTWQQTPVEEETAMGNHSPTGFFWRSTWPWGLDDDKLGPPAILISQDGASWIELVVGHGPVIETPAGIVITQFDEEGDLANEIVVYNGESSSTVQADWPVGDWPGFLGGIGNALILIDGADVWVGEVFED